MLVLLRPKGTPVHKRRGRVYALALLVTSGAALGIYRRGIFFFPHWLAIAALIVTTAGVLAAFQDTAESLAAPAPDVLC
jgi:uncharacterized membrane protein